LDEREGWITCSNSEDMTLLNTQNDVVSVQTDVSVNRTHKPLGRGNGGDREWAGQLFQALAYTRR